MKSLRILSVAVAGLLLVVTVVVAQSGTDNSKPKAAAPQAHGMQGLMGGNNMMDQCQSIMAMRQKMMSDMKAMDAEIVKLVSDMNSAPEGKKLDAMAAVVSKLADQSKAMHEQMPDMQMKMMGHMMEHMQMGKASMAQCPMMNEMMGKPDSSGGAKKTGDAHAPHHPMHD